jgi:broad specificity phosphatase PhoE
MSTIDWIEGGFYFLRHGESENNRLDLVNGWSDSPLSQDGIVQAHEAATLLASEPINRIVTSDLQRARHTAEIVAKTINVTTIDVFAGLRERNWGVFENKPREIRPSLNETPDGGESPEVYADRVVLALRKASLGSNTLLVGHAGTIRVLNRLLGRYDPLERVENSNPVFVSVSMKSLKVLL